MLPSEIINSYEGSEHNVTSLMGAPLREAREAFEREYLRVQIKRFSGNISKTAAFVGMERSALHRKLKLLGISVRKNGDEGGDEED
jgi:two-component system, NtrC family, nitrogen regulation response regulator NtrX